MTLANGGGGSTVGRATTAGNAAFEHLAGVMAPGARPWRCRLECRRQGEVKAASGADGPAAPVPPQTPAARPRRHPTRRRREEPGTGGLRRLRARGQAQRGGRDLQGPEHQGRPQPPGVADGPTWHALPRGGCGAAARRSYHPRSLCAGRLPGRSQGTPGSPGRWHRPQAPPRSGAGTARSPPPGRTAPGPRPGTQPGAARHGRWSYSPAVLPCSPCPRAPLPGCLYPPLRVLPGPRPRPRTVPPPHDRRKVWTSYLRSS